MDITDDLSDGEDSKIKRRTLFVQGNITRLRSGGRVGGTWEGGREKEGGERGERGREGGREGEGRGGEEGRRGGGEGGLEGGLEGDE